MPDKSQFINEPQQNAINLRKMARLVLAAFVLTFIASRAIVFLIMTRRIPDLYIYFGGTHVHHLNFGIFLLAGIGAYLVFTSPSSRKRSVAAVLYGIGLALTFDEFGMWLHLGGGYWQRTSFDAVLILTAMLGLVAYTPPLKKFRPSNWTVLAFMLLAIAIFAFIVFKSFQFAGKHISPELKKIESSGPK